MKLAQDKPASHSLPNPETHSGLFSLLPQPENQFVNGQRILVKKHLCPPPKTKFKENNKGFFGPDYYKFGPECHEFNF